MRGNRGFFYHKVRQQKGGAMAWEFKLQSEAVGEGLEWRNSDGGRSFSSDMVPTFGQYGKVRLRQYVLIAAG